jgi:hypothetical protein
MNFTKIGTVLKYRIVGTVLKYHIVGTVPKSYRKIVQRATIQIQIVLNLPQHAQYLDVLSSEYLCILVMCCLRNV